MEHILQAQNKSHHGGCRPHCRVTRDSRNRPGGSTRPQCTVQEEEKLSSVPHNCSLRSRRNPPPPSSCARLRLVARGIADALAVLGSLRSWSSEPLPGTGPTLELLAAVWRDMSACFQPGPRGSSRKFQHTQRRARKRPGKPKTQKLRAKSPGCQEATVIFSLLRLLTWDLRLVAHSGPCL
ncbi:PREDICTED: interferon lambda-4-like [Condylura cristata]|uniref:interferon lambda-4-like n=1 Tax=Condylura cristata TaxID=143302 RepID=UPI0006434E30|nr:PREDICTED: interferon lambda-4-like [Condylura cristata]